MSECVLKTLWRVGVCVSALLSFHLGLNFLIAGAQGPDLRDSWQTSEETPALSFHSLIFFCFTKENRRIYQGFSLTTEPTKSLEKTEKIPRKPRKFLANFFFEKARVGGSGWFCQLWRNRGSRFPGKQGLNSGTEKQPKHKVWGRMFLKHQAPLLT